MSRYVSDYPLRMEPINEDLQLLLLVLVSEAEVALIGGIEFFVSLN